GRLEKCRARHLEQGTAGEGVAPLSRVLRLREGSPRGRAEPCAWGLGDELLRERASREERPVDVEQIPTAGEEVTLDGRRTGVEPFHAARDLLLPIRAGEEPGPPIGVGDLGRPAPIPLGGQAFREGDENRLLLARHPLQDGQEDRGDVGRLLRDHALRILRQGVFDGVPRGLGADPDVRERPPLGIGIEGAETDPADVGLRVAAAVDRGPTAPAERAELARRRLVLGHEVAARGELEVRRSGRRIAGERGPRSALALLAVAEARGPELALDAEADTAAETAAVEHVASRYHYR